MNAVGFAWDGADAPRAVGARWQDLRVTSSRKRAGPPLPPPEPLACPGSWLPEPYRQAGDQAPCPVCGRTVAVVAPPEDRRYAALLDDPAPPGVDWRREAKRNGHEGSRYR